MWPNSLIFVCLHLELYVRNGFAFCPIFPFFEIRKIGSDILKVWDEHRAILSSLLLKCYFSVGAPLMVGDNPPLKGDL